MIQMKKKSDKHYNKFFSLQKNKNITLKLASKKNTLKLRVVFPFPLFYWLQMAYYRTESLFISINSYLVTTLNQKYLDTHT